MTRTRSAQVGPLPYVALPVFLLVTLAAAALPNHWLVPAASSLALASAATISRAPRKDPHHVNR